MTSAPEKACAEFYYHQIADKFSLKLPRCITNVERFILYRLVCCFFWSMCECLVPLFNKLIQLPLTYSKFANPSKLHTLLSETWNFAPIKTTLLRKTRHLIPIKTAAVMQNYRYREFPQTFLGTIETFWVVFGLPAPHSGFLCQPFISNQFCNSL